MCWYLTARLADSGSLRCWIANGTYDVLVSHSQLTAHSSQARRLTDREHQLLLKSKIEKGYCIDMYHYHMEGSMRGLMAREKKDLVWWKRKFEEPLVPIIVFDNATASLRRADI